MVALRHITAALILLVHVAPGFARFDTPVPNPSDSLFTQTIAESLKHEFSSPDLSFLLMDIRSGQLLASRWENPETPIPLGSLSKPFAALAYGEHHDFQFPDHTCHGTRGGCWRPGGHGKINLTSAIAYSCNSYFRLISANLDAAEVAGVASRFGLDRPDPSASGAALAGMGSGWRISPLHMAEAYRELIGERQQPGVGQIIDGMAESARHGTAAEVDRTLKLTSALAKTGTAPCTHEQHAPGDGFTIALFPADNPRILLMVRVHGVPGAVAAKTAGEMLRRIEN